MRILVALGAFVLVCSALHGRADTPVVRAAMFPALRMYVQQRSREFDQISAERKANLERLAQYVKAEMVSGRPVRLTFICTHNSRRSQMAQVWAATAAAYYGVESVSVFSGGTEATAMNPRTVAALERAGLQIDKTTDGMNPRYAVRFQETGPLQVCFSKIYHEVPNPMADFCAVMTCSHADQNCPVVQGSSLRVAIPFEDPKVSDGTPAEAKTYDERCAQISREMLYLFSHVK